MSLFFSPLVLHRIMKTFANLEWMVGWVSLNSHTGLCLRPRYGSSGGQGQSVTEDDHVDRPECLTSGKGDEDDVRISHNRLRDDIV